MRIIPVTQLESGLRATLNQCAETGEALVVEMPDGKLLLIERLDVQQGDSRVDDLLATNPDFRELVAQSMASPRRPFPPANP